MTRHLYLLALFQLVGGPLVLVAVMTMGKLVSTEVQQQGTITAAVISTLGDQTTWQSVADAMTQYHSTATTSLPTPQDPFLPSLDIQEKKIFAIAWSPVKLPVHHLPIQDHISEPKAPPGPTWSIAPPSPPPRSV
ncbi:hypothetical protein FEM03_18905 [Phragmitibacter flavus]|uniref:Uncharacterized protein n=1 Tax=Phragmitibacter flavus TaxID=2576071 RepID=A0A5R8KA26_9BACT|nr:hypothetical protein [Phragmitibacter flavus]TLD69170.1 hypothetical protein FEM03_18905 [Phragmitibacter flavus]